MITVTIEREESGWWFVTDSVTDRYGSGRTREDALAMWRDCFWTYFDALADERTRLSPRLQRHLTAMDAATGGSAT